MRSPNVHTLYATIYEFKGNYFVIEESQQGADAEVTPYQRASESRALAARLPIGGSVEELGGAARRALVNFDIEPPKYDSWDTKPLVKQLVGWLGARGFATIEKNSRMVVVTEELSNRKIKVYPSDNYQANPWYGIELEKVLVTDAECTDEALGVLILEAFAQSTYHPHRVDPVVN